MRQRLGLGRARFLYIDMSGALGASDFGSGRSVIVASVRSRTLATEIAFSSTTRTTFVGSMIAMIPADAVTASASGLDPHISPQYAHLQLPRVAAARGIGEAQVREMLVRHTDLPRLGVLGEPRVNVLLLNVALDAVARGNANSR